MGAPLRAMLVTSHNRHTPHAQPAASKHSGGKYPRSPARARTRQRVQPGAGRGATTTTRRVAALRRPGEHLRRYGHELAAKRTRDAQPLQLRQQALPVRLSQRTLCHDSRDLMQSQAPAKSRIHVIAAIGLALWVDLVGVDLRRVLLPQPVASRLE